METSLRYGDSKALRESKALRIHAKEKFPANSPTHLLVRGELDTRLGAPNFASAMIRHTYLDLMSTLGVGVKYDKYDKFRYCIHGKKGFPVTSDGLVSFTVKGLCDTDKDFKQKKLKGATELSWSILNFQKRQDVRFKVGYELVDQVPYFQIRENNWTLNVDVHGRWNVRFDL